MKMMKPLNTLVYIKNNPKKIIPQMFAVALGIFLVYFICIIGGGTKYELNNNVAAPYEKMSEIYVLYPKTDNDQLYNYFSKNSNVEKILYSSGTTNITAKMIVEECGTYCPYLNETNIKYMMNMYNLKLSQGRLPQNKNEILFNENYAKGRNLKVGDYYGTDVNEKDDLNGKYKLVGEYKGDIVMSFLYSSESPAEMKEHGYGLILIPKTGHLAALNKDIHSFSVAHPNQYSVDDYGRQYGFISTMFMMFNVFAVVILGVTVFVITFTIVDINYVHFTERLPEFSMLQALGYSQKNIRHKQFSEIIIVIFLGSCGGFILSLLGGYILNELYCIPNGIPLMIISPWYFLLSVLVPVLVAFFSCISINKLIKKMHIVDVIEGRE